MIVRTSTHPGWLSCSHLVAARPGADAVLIDAGAPTAPIDAALVEHDLRLRRVLLTHHHPDHVCEAEHYRRRHGARVSIHPSEADLVPACDRPLGGGERLELDGLTVAALHIPGHTRGQLAFHVVADGVGALFTGDTLFRGSIGGTLGPGHTTFEDLRRSLVDVLLAFPDETPVYPGHAGPTTIGLERATNPFLRAFLGLDPTLDEPCRARGRPARLRVWARDYDGGHKAWVRFEDTGQEAVLGGSGVERG